MCARFPVFAVLLGLLVLLALAAPGRTMAMTETGASLPPAPGGGETITLGGGCFWCLEAIFLELRGVRSVESGYSGGKVANPSYQDVCTGATGHAEVVQVVFDPQVLSLHDLLSIFFTMHDPTTLNRQGADLGTQYRSVIFYRNEEQKAVAETVMKEVSAARIWDRPLVTQLVPFEAFYKAEAYHQDYYRQNPNQGYCRVVIEPKVRKFREKYASLLAK